MAFLPAALATERNMTSTDGTALAARAAKQLLVLGEDGPAHSHPMALNAALSGLMQTGLEREARALAIEAAIAKGI